MSPETIKIFFLSLPFPDSILSPNARVHWAKKMRVVRAHRTAATIEAVQYAYRFDPSKVRSVDVELNFFPKINRLRDEDNALARCKPYMDGIASALGINDCRFHYTAINIKKADKANPRVEIKITLHEEENE